MIGPKKRGRSEAVVEAVRMYRSTFEAGPTVLMGDLNSNTIWDKTHPKDRNHSALVNMLDELGMVSAYHAHHDEKHGGEASPTFYLDRAGRQSAHAVRRRSQRHRHQGKSWSAIWLRPTHKRLVSL